MDLSGLNDGPGQQGERKERQLCRQVHEAVSEALAMQRDDVLQDVWVAGVEPLPGGRLAVVVQGPARIDAEAVERKLEKVAGYLRTEVANSINRKRTPLLMFRVLPPAGRMEYAPDAGAPVSEVLSDDRA